MERKKELAYLAVVFFMKRKVENGIREIIRDFGKDLKKKGIDNKEFGLVLLDATGEALELLKKEAQEEKQK